MLTAQQAEELGYTVDRHVYPWVAYKGPRFAPIVYEPIETPAYGQRGEEIALADLIERVAPIIEQAVHIAAERAMTPRIALGFDPAGDNAPAVMIFHHESTAATTVDETHHLHPEDIRRHLENAIAIRRLATDIPDEPTSFETVEIAPDLEPYMNAIDQAVHQIALGTVCDCGDLGCTDHMDRTVEALQLNAYPQREPICTCGHDLPGHQRSTTIGTGRFAIQTGQPCLICGCVQFTPNAETMPIGGWPPHTE